MNSEDQEELIEKLESLKDIFNASLKPPIVGKQQVDLNKCSSLLNDALGRALSIAQSFKESGSHWDSSSIRKQEASKPPNTRATSPEQPSRNVGAAPTDEVLSLSFKLAEAKQQIFQLNDEIKKSQETISTLSSLTQQYSRRMNSVRETMLKEIIVLKEEARRMSLSPDSAPSFIVSFDYISSLVVHMNTEREEQDVRDVIEGKKGKEVADQQFDQYLPLEEESDVQRLKREGYSAYDAQQELAKIQELLDFEKEAKNKALRSLTMMAQGAAAQAKATMEEAHQQAQEAVKEQERTQEQMKQSLMSSYKERYKNVAEEQTRLELASRDALIERLQQDLTNMAGEQDKRFKVLKEGYERKIGDLMELEAALREENKRLSAEADRARKEIHDEILELQSAYEAKFAAALAQFERLMKQKESQMAQGGGSSTSYFLPEHFAPIRKRPEQLRADTPDTHRPSSRTSGSFFITSVGGSHPPGSPIRQSRKPYLNPSRPASSANRGLIRTAVAHAQMAPKERLTPTQRAAAAMRDILGDATLLPSETINISMDSPLTTQPQKSQEEEEREKFIEELIHEAEEMSAKHEQETGVLQRRLDAAQERLRVAEERNVVVQEEADQVNEQMKTLSKQLKNIAERASLRRGSTQQTTPYGVINQSLSTDLTAVLFTVNEVTQTVNQIKGDVYLKFDEPLVEESAAGNGNRSKPSDMVSMMASRFATIIREGSFVKRPEKKPKPKPKPKVVEKTKPDNANNHREDNATPATGSEDEEANGEHADGTSKNRRVAASKPEAAKAVSKEAKSKPNRGISKERKGAVVAPTTTTNQHKKPVAAKRKSKAKKKNVAKARVAKLHDKTESDSVDSPPPEEISGEEDDRSHSESSSSDSEESTDQEDETTSAESSEESQTSDATTSTTSGSESTSESSTEISEYSSDSEEESDQSGSESSSSGSIAVSRRKKEKRREKKAKSKSFEKKTKATKVGRSNAVAVRGRHDHAESEEDESVVSRTRERRNEKCDHAVHARAPERTKKATRRSKSEKTKESAERDSVSPSFEDEQPNENQDRVAKDNKVHEHTRKAKRRSKSETMGRASAAPTSSEESERDEPSNEKHDRAVNDASAPERTRNAKRRSKSEKTTDTVGRAAVSSEGSVEDERPNAKVAKHTKGRIKTKTGRASVAPSEDERSNGKAQVAEHTKMAKGRKKSEKTKETTEGRTSVVPSSAESDEEVERPLNEKEDQTVNTKTRNVKRSKSETKKEVVGRASIAPSSSATATATATDSPASRTTANARTRKEAAPATTSKLAERSVSRTAVDKRGESTSTTTNARRGSVQHEAPPSGSDLTVGVNDSQDNAPAKTRNLLSATNAGDRDSSPLSRSPSRPPSVPRQIVVPIPSPSQPLSSLAAQSSAPSDKTVEYQPQSKQKKLKLVEEEEQEESEVASSHSHKSTQTDIDLSHFPEEVAKLAAAAAAAAAIGRSSKRRSSRSSGALQKQTAAGVVNNLGGSYTPPQRPGSGSVKRVGGAKSTWSSELESTPSKGPTDTVDKRGKGGGDQTAGAAVHQRSEAKGRKDLLQTPVRDGERQASSPPSRFSPGSDDEVDGDMPPELVSVDTTNGSGAVSLDPNSDLTSPAGQQGFRSSSKTGRKIAPEPIQTDSTGPLLRTVSFPQFGSAPDTSAQGSLLISSIHSGSDRKLQYTPGSLAADQDNQQPYGVDAGGLPSMIVSQIGPTTPMVDRASLQDSRGNLGVTFDEESSRAAEALGENEAVIGLGLKKDDQTFGSNSTKANSTTVTAMTATGVDQDETPHQLEEVLKVQSMNVHKSNRTKAFTQVVRSLSLEPDSPAPGDGRSPGDSSVGSPLPFSVTSYMSPTSNSSNGPNASTGGGSKKVKLEPKKECEGIQKSFSEIFSNKQYGMGAAPTVVGTGMGVTAAPPELPRPVVDDSSVYLPFGLSSSTHKLERRGDPKPQPPVFLPIPSQPPPASKEPSDAFFSHHQIPLVSPQHAKGSGASGNLSSAILTESLGGGKAPPRPAPIKPSSDSPVKDVSNQSWNPLSSPEASYTVVRSSAPNLLLTVTQAPTIPQGSGTVVPSKRPPQKPSHSERNQSGRASVASIDPSRIKSLTAKKDKEQESPDLKAKGGAAKERPLSAPLTHRHHSSDEDENEEIRLFPFSTSNSRVPSASVGPTPHFLFPPISSPQNAATAKSNPVGGSHNKSHKMPLL